MGPRTAQHATAFDRAVALLTGLSLLCVFLLPSQSGASFPTYLVALLVLLGGTGRWREFFDARALPFALLALLLYFAASVGWSQAASARGAFSICSRSVLMLAFMVALSTSMDRVPQTMRWLPRALAITAAIAAAAAIVDLQLHPTWDGRLAGLGQLRSSVMAGMAFNAGLVCAVSVLLTGATAWRATGAVCAALTAAAVYATGSRSAYLGGAIGVWTLLLWARRGSGAVNALVWFAGPALCAGAVAVVLTLEAGWTEVLFPRGDSFRIEIWAAEWRRLAAQGLWFGLGVLVPDDVVLQGQAFLHPHSLYLASALQGGLVGLLLLLGVLLAAGFNLYHARRLEEARLGLALLAAGMSAYLLDGWELIDKVSVSWLVLWVPVSIAVGVGSRMQKQLGTAGTGPVQRLLGSIQERR